MLQDGVIRYVNPRLTQLTGYETSADLIGRDGASMIAPEFRDEVMARMARIIRGEILAPHTGYQVIRRDGSPLWVSSGAAPTTWDGRPALLGFIVDITDRKQAEDAVRASEERFRIVAEQTGQIIFDYDFVTEAAVWAGAVFSIIGYTPAELAAIPPGWWLERIHPDDREAYVASHKAMSEGISPLLATFRFRHAAGRWIHLQANATLIHGGTGAPHRMLGTLANVTQQQEAAEAIRRLNAELEQRVRDRTAELDRRVAEVERLNAELRTSQQTTDRTAARLQEVNSNLIAANQELEAFSYSVSHDLRAPLRNISGFIELLRRRSGDRLDAEAGRFFTIVSGETVRMGALIDDLLTFSRLGRAELKLEPVALAGLIAAVQQQELASDLAGRDIEWRIQPMPPVRADRVLLRQVVVNLLSNAVKFTRQRHPALIEFGVEPAPPGAKTAVFFCRDNGAGFNPKYLDKMFRVFQRLHNAREFEGTGIGLANVKRIVTRHGGRRLFFRAPHALPMKPVLSAPRRARLPPFGAVALAVFLGFAAQGRGADAPERSLEARQPLVVGATNDSFPYGFVNEHGKWDGFAADLLDAVADVMRLRMRRTMMPARELHESFRQGQFDLLQAYSQTADREGHADFSVPFLELQGAVFVRRDAGVRQLADLEGRPFAIIGRDSIGERFLRDHGIRPQILAVSSTTEALGLIERGRIVGTFASQLTALTILRREHFHETVMLGAPHPGYEIRHCFAVHKGDRALLVQLNEGLAILHQTGRFDAIFRKWFESLDTPFFTREQVVTYVTGALAVALAAALWGLARQVLLGRRIRQLNATLEQRVHERTTELELRVAEVERLNTELQVSQRTTDRTAARLQEVNANLFAANQELEAFSYTVSHDLRAPLRNISGFIELLRRRSGAQLDAESARFFNTVSTEAVRMGALIDDLLTFSRLGRAELKLEPVALAGLIAAVQQQELAADLAGRDIEWRIQPMPPVQTDRVLLRQVVVNLLSNAVKFTRQRHPALIEFGGEPAPPGAKTAVFFCRDNGAGFNPKYLDKMFRVFQRLHNAREFEGTGIGLANVKRIVTRHGGRVWAEGAVDSGAVFRFTLPLSQPNNPES